MAIRCSSCGAMPSEKHGPNCIYRPAPLDGIIATLANRQSTYGPPAINFQRIADLLNVVFLDKLEEPFTAVDVGYISLYIKLGRLMQTPSHRDSLHDLKGYVACIEEILDAADKEPKP